MSNSRVTIYLLNIGDYAPELTKITYPLIRFYARKIGAQVVEMRERRFPEWPVVCEKWQVYQRAQESGSEWHIYFDSDTLVHPEMPDWTAYIPRDTVAFNGKDMAAVRWRYDKYFLRDGRNIGTCGWFSIASDWCTDLWHPCDDMTPEQVIDSCYPTVDEWRSGVIDRGHLTDDWVVSRNIARYGLKHTTISEIAQRLFPDGCDFLWHAYTIPYEEKVLQARETLDRWEIPVGLFDE